VRRNLRSEAATMEAVVVIRRRSHVVFAVVALD
jgi:hypothetical protein